MEKMTIKEAHKIVDEFDEYIVTPSMELTRAEMFIEGFESCQEAARTERIEIQEKLNKLEVEKIGWESRQAEIEELKNELDKAICICVQQARELVREQDGMDLGDTETKRLILDTMKEMK